MSKMKELFMQYQQESGDDFIDDDYHFQKWLEEKEKEEKEYWEAFYSGSIFPPDMEYDDEYYKSTYTPTPEEENEAFKLFNKEK